MASSSEASPEHGQLVHVLSNPKVACKLKKITIPLIKPDLLTTSDEEDPSVQAEKILKYVSEISVYYPKANDLLKQELDRLSQRKLFLCNSCNSVDTYYWCAECSQLERKIGSQEKTAKRELIISDCINLLHLLHEKIIIVERVCLPLLASCT